MEGMEPISMEVINKLKEDPDTLAAELQSYHEAIEGEFTAEDVEELRDRMKQHVPEAEQAVVYLLNNAASESVRLNAAKYVITTVFGKMAEADTVDPMTKLLAELRNNDTDRNSS